jgi:SAM-dependent methyltransferase
MQPSAWRIAADVARETVANAAMALPPVRTWRLRKPRAGSSFAGAPEQLDRYAFQALRGVEGVIGSIAGRDVLEYGPGDTLSAGLSMLAAGASSYHALDRFVPDYASAEAKRWYGAVRDGWDAAFPGRPWPADLDPARFPEAYGDRVGTLDDAVESARSERRFDVVTSWQVGEHVRDIQTLADQTARFLRPGGVAIHRVDFGPHAWERYDDPLLFLRFPAALWRLMGSNRGLPNRFRHHEFVQAWTAAGLTVECRDLRTFDPGEIEFDKLDRRFRTMPRASLLVKDVVYVCRHRAA